jgi:FKBP-type peptidyl-prolyl cis-trans isomerase (trigger factor)
MSDNVETLNTENNNLVAQVLGEINKSKREGVKSKLKKNLTEIEELKVRVRLLEKENEAILAEFNKGLV